jgi:hypothetical protein
MVTTEARTRSARSQSRFMSAADLAVGVRQRLRELHRRSPPLNALVEVLQVAFFASLRTEEADPVRCTLTYISRQHPDPNPPKRIVADRWNALPFGQARLLTVETLIKLSKAAEPGSSLAVCQERNGRVAVWGLIDQQERRLAYVAREVEAGAQPPGLLQVEIRGTGAIEVYLDYTMLASLRQGRLTFGFHDVLREPGPIRQVVAPAIVRLTDAIRAEVGDAIFHQRDHWPDSIAYYWTESLSRIVLAMQRFGHGGSIVVTPDAQNTGLRVAHAVSYDRLPNALRRLLVHTVRNCAADDEISEAYLDRHAAAIPAGLYLDAIVSDNDRDETRDEVTGCIRFIAALSRVDGAVVLNRELSARGFGAVITVEAQPPSVWIAGDARASQAKLRKLDPEALGTRHRSMMRFCFHRPGSLGLVVSQDGDIRAMLRVGRRLIVWEDVKLRRA